MDPVPAVPPTNTLASEVKVQISDFAKSLRELKKARDWSNKQLGEQLGISTNTLSAWVRGEKEPRTDRRKVINAKMAALMKPPEPEPEPETSPAIETAEEPTEPVGAISSAPEATPEPPKPPQAAKPLVRPLTPQDRNWR